MPVTVIVRLTPSEMAFAAHVGVARRLDNIARGRVARPTYGMGNDGAWSADVEGAAGELAVAKWACVYWSGSIGDLKAADVGPLQVRTTTHPRGRLILHDRDKTGAAYVLARGVAPLFHLVGWTWGYDGINPGFWEQGTGRPGYFVPDSSLRTMSDLRFILAAGHLPEARPGGSAATPPPGLRQPHTEWDQRDVAS